MAEQDSVIVLIAYLAQPGKAEAARDALRKLIKTVIASEKDCLGIQLLQSADAPERFSLVERWTSRQAYEGPHMTTAHLQAFIATAPGFLAGPPDISFWNEIQG